MINQERRKFMDLGKKLYELRKNKHYSQEQLAEKLGVSRQTVSNWELNQTTPDLLQAKEIANFYQISLDELVGINKKEILTTKVSNVEKLAGIILTILKVIGVLFILYFIFMIIAVFCFSNIKTNVTNIAQTMNCTLNDHAYEITLENSQKIDCPSCNEEMINDIEKFLSSNDIDQNAIEIENYFQQKGGSCQ